MSTLYDLLEVSQKASKEVIEKAYRVLAKKYHPDLQTPENRENAEAKMKKINEAYDILSDDIKRKAYDESLKIVQNQYNNSQTTQEEQKYKDMQRRRYEEQLKKQQEQMREQMEQQLQQDYENAYYNYLRSLGYRIKERWTWKKTKLLLLTILIMIGIFVILWFIPLTHNIMVDFYENNQIVKIIVDIIWGIIKAIFQTIWNLISSIFK